MQRNSSKSSAEIVELTPDRNGIRNTVLTGVRLVDSKKGKMILISFRQEGTGATTSFMESSVDPNNKNTNGDVFKNKKGTVENPNTGKPFTKFEKAIDDQDVRLKHMFGALTGIDYTENPVIGDTDEEYFQNYIDTCGDIEELKKKVEVEWLKRTWYTKGDGTAGHSFPSYPPFISTNIKPKVWSPTKYEVENRVFERPQGVAFTPDNQDDDNQPSAIAYDANSDNSTEVEGDDFDSDDLV